MTIVLKCDAIFSTLEVTPHIFQHIAGNAQPVVVSSHCVTHTALSGVPGKGGDGAGSRGIVIVTAAQVSVEICQQVRISHVLVFS